MQKKSYTSLKIEVIIPKIQEKKVKLRGIRNKGKSKIIPNLEKCKKHD